MSLFDILRGNSPDKESLNNLQNKVDKLFSLLGIVEDGDKSDINIKTLVDSFEELKREQTLLNEEIRNLKSEIELFNQKKDGENTIANENKSVIPTTNLAQQEKIVEKYFYMEPSRIGEFKINAKLRNADENDRDAFYVILVSDDNDSFAEFYPVSNKSERLLLSKEDILDPVCKVQSSSRGGNLTVISNGKLKKEDAKWVLADRCVIKFS